MLSDFWKQGCSSVYGEDCGGGWLPASHSSVVRTLAAQAWVQFLATAGFSLSSHLPHNSVFFFQLSLEVLSPLE